MTSMSGALSSGTAVLQPAIHALEAALPEAAIGVDPRGRLLERLGVEVDGAELRHLAAGDQAGALQHLEVLGDRLNRDREALGELGEGGVAAAQPAQDLPSGRVGERGEGL